MAHIIEICNPFEPLRDSKTTLHAGNITIADWLRLRFPGFIKFEKPTLCIVNGNYILQAQWETFVIRENDVVNIVTLAQGLDPITWFYIAVALFSIASVVLVLSIPKPKLPGEQPDASPIYDLRGQNNQNRFGNPIEVAYGKVRMWPSYAARPYNRFKDNDQYQYQLLCLGQGKFEIHEIRIEDTALSEFADIVYEIYEPGEEVTLFPDNVITSVEVGGIEMLATNEAGFDGLTGAFVANPTGTQTNRLEVDISFPTGLYLTDKNGALGYLTINCFFEYREIDADGAPIGDWTEFINFSRAMAVAQPQRFTVGADVPAGRYEVRGQRTGNKNLSNNAQNTLRWEQLRAFLPSTKDYGNVTLLAIAARATNNLNDTASNRVNVIATRKLPIWNGTEWSAPTATRSISWAACDVLRAIYGAQLDATYIDLPKLLALDADWTADERFFDFVFEQKTSVWDALRTIFRVGRALPMLEGSLVSCVRDIPQTVPKAAFNQDNIVAGSFKWDMVLAGSDDFDGVQIQYTDPTSWQNKTINCGVGDDPAAADMINPEKITLAGCTDRQAAWEEGLYIRACRKYFRENISFQTGLEGLLPAYNSLIMVSHDVPKWGKAGRVTAYDDGSQTLTLSQPVDFTGGSKVVYLRKKNGDVFGPAAVTAGATEFEAVLADALDEDDYFFDNMHELPLFFFGTTGTAAQLCKVVLLSSTTEDTVDVKAIVLGDFNVFAGDDSDAPALPTIVLPPPANPGVAHFANCGLTAYVPNPSNALEGQFVWPLVTGAVSYRVQQSANGSDWVDLGMTAGNFKNVSVTPGQSLHLRVAPLSGGGAQGAWCSPPSGPGAGDPPGNDDDYADIVWIRGGHGASVRCKGRGGDAYLCGRGEFVEESVPPRVYKRMTASGGVHGEVYPDNTCTGPHGYFDIEWNGDAIWTPATEGDLSECTLDNGMDSAVSTDGGTVGHSSIPTDHDVGPSGCYSDNTKSTTSQQEVNTGACCDIGFGVAWQKHTGTRTLALSDEDTDQAALDRLKGTFPAWADIDWDLPCMVIEGCCQTAWGMRGAGEYSFNYVEKKAEITASGMSAAGLSRCVASVWRHLIDGDGSDAALAEEHELVTFADGGGDVSFEFDLPTLQGYNYYIHDLKFYVLV